MTSYNLKPIIPPSLAAQEKKAARKKLLEEVRARRKLIYKRFHKKMQLQAGISAIGKPLRLRIVSPIIAHPWPSVNIENHGEGVLVLSWRQRQVSMDRQTISGRESDRLHFGEGIVA